MGTEIKKELHEHLVVEKTKPVIARPPMYQVVIYNDDYTPMDFVVEILAVFFGMDPEIATVVMLQVHNAGKGVCGVYSRDIAETKVNQVNNYARANEYPLLCGLEVA